MSVQFPTISTGDVAKYPCSRTVTTRAAVHRFCNQSTQRWAKGVDLVEFDLQFNRIVTADKEIIRSFYNGRRGEFDTTWGIIFAGQHYYNCQFIGNRLTTSVVGPGLWQTAAKVRGFVQATRPAVASAVFPAIHGAVVTQMPYDEGDEWATSQVYLDSGSAYTWSWNDSPMRRFQVRFDVIPDSELQTIDDFFSGCRGPVGRFSFTDDAGVVYPKCHFLTDRIRFDYQGVNQTSVVLPIEALL